MKNYITNCTESTAEKINDMVEQAKEIKYNTFIKQINIDNLKNLFPFYCWNNAKGLKLKNDWCISYFKSYYNNKPCLFICHSAIEYIFV